MLESQMGPQRLAIAKFATARTANVPTFNRAVLADAQASYGKRNSSVTCRITLGYVTGCR
jgi:hypothetical protein